MRAVHTMAGNGVLLVALCAASLLLTGVLCQDDVEEDPLSCFKSSSDCLGSQTSEPYSACCATGTESFVIERTCYACAELISFSLPTYTVDEGAGFVRIEVERKVNPGTNFFFFSTVITDASAKAGIDYGQFSDVTIGLVTIVLADELTVVSGVSIFDDSLVEYNENFTVSLLHLSKDFLPLGNVTGRADVIIIDNDQVDISIMPLSVLLMEPSSVLFFSLNKTGEAVRPVHVMLDVSDPELQYNGSRLLTFEPEVERIEFVVEVPDDVIVEAAEDHMILLSVPAGETGVNLLQDTVTVTVEDNDVLDVALEAERVNGSEADGRIVVEVRKIGANERPVFVRIFTEPGTAESGVDFTPIDVVLEFLPGDTLLSVEVNVSSDDVVESEESFVVSLEVPSTETGVNLQLNTTTVLLQDSDFVVVTVDEMAVMVAEGESVDVTVRVEEGALARDVIIDLSLSSGGGRDVMLSSPSVILNADNLNGTISISAIDDVFYEGAESLQLAITSSDGAVRFLPASISVEVNIEDTDSPQLSFSQLVFSFNETAVSGEVVVTFSAQTETTHSWRLISIADTATEGEDYSQVNTSLEFDDSNRERRVSFDIFDDLVSEGLEKFALELRDVTGGVVNSSEVEIVDNEELLVSFTETVFTVSEGEQLFSLVVNKSGVTTSDITITINLTDFTAKGGSDYGFFPTSEFLALTVILANETNVTYALPIFDDDIIENVESFGASLLLTSDDGTIVLGDISKSEVFIVDNDRLRVFLSVSDDDVVPEGGSVEERTVIFMVSRDENATLNRSVSVLFSTSDGSALVSRGDYTETIVNFTFTPRGPLSFVAEVLVLDDQTVEAMEQFSVSLSAPADYSAVELPDNATDIYIMDDDKIQVDFSDIEYIVNEDEMVAMVFLTKTGDNDIPVVVSVETRTADDTAIAGSDYNSTVQPLEFLTGDTQLPLIITIVDDSVLEETESFTVRLILTAEDINVILGPGNITRVVIRDNDDVTVEFSEAEYRVREDGGSVSVRVVMSGAAERNVEIDLFTEDGTATANTDYTLLNRTLVFTAGEDQEIEVLLAVLQDSTCEDQEEVFSVRLVSSDVSVLLGELDTSNVTIEEDDMCGIGFGEESYSVVEELHPILSVCVERRGNIDRDISLAVVAVELRQIPVDEQALAGSDFTLMPTVLTLPSVDTEICFNITIMDDSRPEGSERFGIRIILPDPELMTFRSEVNVTITDQDMVPTEPPPPAVPSVEFEASAYTVTEADGNVVIGLRINRPAADEMSPSMQIISVLFSTADGTAKSPTDYVAHINTTVNFEQDVTRATVTVIVEMDGLIEGPEAFSVFLSLPEMLVTRVTLGNITTATVTIFDSDTEEPDRLVNDTVVGDPLFVVPLHLTEDSHDFEKQPSLCYEIHGQAGWVFNLVSDHCTSVNALYEGSRVQEDLNVIAEVGVTAVDALGNCINIRVSVKNDCVPEIIQGGRDVSAVRYENAGVFVRRMGRGRVRVSVPNCANVQLVMWIMCSNVSGQPQMRFDIMRGFNLDPTSHGLLGQFWNIPVRVLPFVFSGQVTYDLQQQELYLIEVTPQLSPSRQFVAEYYPVSWDLSRPDPCLYAGDQQGGRIREIKTYNDPVIEQNYRLYRTDGIFETDYRFSQFNVSRCG